MYVKVCLKIGRAVAGRYHDPLLIRIVRFLESSLQTAVKMNDSLLRRAVAYVKSPGGKLPAGVHFGGCEVNWT